MARRLQLVAATAVALAALALAPGANAAINQIRVIVSQPGVNGPTKAVYFDLRGLDTALSTRYTVIRPGVAIPIHDKTEFSGVESYSTSTFTGLEPGDVVEIRQPSAAITPSATFTTPTASFTIAGNTVSGSVGAMVGSSLTSYETCLENQEVIRIPAGGGSFSATFAQALAPGRDVILRSVDAAGSEFRLEQRVPGERACFEADGVPPQYSIRVPGEKEPRLYRVQINDLTPAHPTARLVIRRAGNAIVDASKVASSSVAFEFAEQPLPGDQLELYRPQEAPAPSQVSTIPAISGVFDASVDLAVITAPAARELRAFVCEPYVCAGSGRVQLDAPAGRTFFDFTKPQGYYAAYALDPDALMAGFIQSATDPIAYRFAMPAGDLVSPAQKLTVASKFKLASLLKAFKKGLKVRLRSNEAGPAKLTLAIGKTRLATGATTAKVGTVTVKLRFTKSGIKALKKLKAKGRKFKSRKATLTSVVTDASGNGSTTRKSLTISR